MQGMALWRSCVAFWALLTRGSCGTAIKFDHKLSLLTRIRVCLHVSCRISSCSWLLDVVEPLWQWGKSTFQAALWNSIVRCYSNCSLFIILFLQTFVSVLHCAQPCQCHLLLCEPEECASVAARKWDSKWQTFHGAVCHVSKHFGISNDKKIVITKKKRGFEN